ncbi:MAG: tryptophan synthase subunit alpha [Bacteroidales bacterium]
MMRVDKKIREEVDNGRKGLIIYTILGYPDIATSLKALQILRKYNITVFETAIPVAQGLSPVLSPTIRNAHKTASSNKVTVKEVTIIYSKFRPNLYIIHKGTENNSLESLFEEMEDKVDCILFGWREKVEVLKKISRSYHVQVAQLVSPHMNRKTMLSLAKNAEGIIYLTIAPRPYGPIFPLPLIRKTLRILKTITDVPVCCGYGIKKLSDIKLISSLNDCDGIIIGTQALIELGKGIKSFENYIKKVIAITHSLEASRL